MVIHSIIPKKISFDIDLENLSSKFLNRIDKFNFLIIGGAGTIGSNYIKCLLRFRPKKIVVVDTNENALTELVRDLRSSNLLDYNPIFITYPVNLLSDVFDKIFKSDTFDVVANFSAHKHVRSEKDKLSIEALIKNNIYGAIKLLNLCLENKPKFFFSVSTDKATNPVNIMGASKSIMEKLILSYQHKIRVSTARFANVAFSNGSLLKGFQNRILKNQPLSCPSDIKRFFVTPEQSGEICLLATFLGQSGNIFFPKLNFHSDQLYFKDIAFDFLKYHGFKPLVFNSEKEAKESAINTNIKEYPIYLFQSDTSGEKKFEEFYSDNENYNLDSFESLGFIETNKYEISFSDVVFDFDNIFNNPKSTKSDIVSVIKKYAPDFNHNATGKNLDEKM